MAGSLNKVCLIGNLGADPEIRSTQDGRKIANFSIATSESWKDKNTGEKKEVTEWHRVVVFNEGVVGVIENYVKKGHKVYIEGMLKTRKWTDNNDIERYSTEVVLQNFNGTLTMLESKGGGGPPPADSERDFGKQSSGGPPMGGNDLDDEIPF